MIFDKVRSLSDGTRSRSHREEERGGTTSTAESRIGDRRDNANIATGERSRVHQAKNGASSSGYHPAIQDSRMTFGFFVETKFIPEHVQHKTLAGQIHYHAMLKHLLKPENVNRMFNPREIARARLKSVPDWPYLDEVRLCDITSDHVRRLMASASVRKYSSQTVKHIKNVICAIISHAQTEGCFSGQNPAVQVKLPPMTRKSAHNLTIDQTTAMLELMQYPEKEIALITITTGMNVLEICNLHWKHVNLTDSDRYVEGELVPARSIAVRSKWNRIALADAKRGRKRNIEIPEPMVAILASLYCKRQNVSPGDFVLTSESGQPVSPVGIRSARLKPIGRKLGLPWLSWRVLARAHTSLLMELRAQLNHHIANVAQGKSAISEVGPSPSGSGASCKSDTMGSKFSCRSFRVGR